MTLHKDLNENGFHRVGEVSKVGKSNLSYDFGTNSFKEASYILLYGSYESENSSKIIRVGYTQNPSRRQKTLPHDENLKDQNPGTALKKLFLRYIGTNNLVIFLKKEDDTPSDRKQQHNLRRKYEDLYNVPLENRTTRQA